MMCGHMPMGASEWLLMADAFSEIKPIMRSAMGLRSWSCGGLTVWCS